MVDQEEMCSSLTKHCIRVERSHALLLTFHVASFGTCVTASPHSTAQSLHVTASK